MQFGGNLAPLPLLDLHQLLVQAAVFVAGSAEGAGQHVEPVSEKRDLLLLGRIEPGGVIARFQIEEAAREGHERIEHTAECRGEHQQNQRVETYPGQNEGRELAPGLGEFVRGIAGDDHRDGAVCGTHQDRAADQLRTHQVLEPFRHPLLDRLAIDQIGCAGNHHQIAETVDQHDANMAQIF